MPTDLQATLIQLFEQVQHDLDTVPAVPLEAWPAGSDEWRLLSSFRAMAEQVQQRLQQVRQSETRLRQREAAYRDLFETVYAGLDILDPDVTERAQAEQHLREQKPLYRSIFEATYDALCIFDLDRVFVEVNPALCQMVGYTPEELIGMHASVVFAPATQARLTASLENPKVGRRYQGTILFQRKDGTTFPVDMTTAPIIYHGKPHGLGVARDITEHVEAQHLLAQRVEERTRELAALLEISQTMAAAQHLQPLLGLVLEQLKSVVPYTGATISTVEAEELVIQDYRSPFPEAVQRHLRTPLTTLGPLWERIPDREPLLVQDVREQTPLAQAFQEALGALGESAFASIRAALLIPLTRKEQVSGLLLLTSNEVGAFTSHHAALAQVIANQAAIAIANARLYAQAQALAALEERQKLARELHDSVSQALYGISLGAHTARKALEQNPAQVAEPLDYVLSLAEAGLAEMRALIFELRPESLETEGLVAALTKQGTALQARHELLVHLDLCDEPDLPLSVKQELYRIAQEALHNTVKHARARQVNLRLSQTKEAVLLEVRDDGLGFDPQGAFPGHLGLHSMRERVSRLGGTLQIESAPGQGTRLAAQVPLLPTR